MVNRSKLTRRLVHRSKLRNRMIGWQKKAKKRERLVLDRRKLTHPRKADESEVQKRDR